MRLRLLEIVTILMLGIEMLLTRHLWGTSHVYPRVPFFSGLVNLPGWIEWLGLGCVIIAAVLVALSWFIQKESSKFSRTAWIFLGIGLIWLVLFDQHRFQTWIWQAILYAFCLGVMKREQSLRWMQYLTIGIYFYSAVSKLDASFANSYGQIILDGLLQALHLQPGWSQQARWGIVLCFPLFELLLAILLLIPRSRFVGLLFSYLMHIALFLALGPWGLNHQTPVLMWNIFFIVQNSILFWPARSEKHARITEAQPANKPTRWPAYVMTLSLIFSATEWFDLCDIWPGWGLYSARGARVVFFVDESEVDKIPDEMKHLLAAPVFEHSWRKLDCHRFSFEETNSPSYPEDRTQFAVAVALIERFDLQKIRVVHHNTANRLTGKRELTELNRLQDLEKFSKRFFFSTKVR